MNTRLLIGLAALWSSAWAQTLRIPIILDTDIGNDIDDAFALAFALQSPELDIRAIVTSRFEADTRARLAHKILKAYGRTDIPLASGGSEALLNVQHRPPTPQFDLLDPGDVNPNRSGVQLIVDTLLVAREKITIVPVGPLTNVALALKTDPRIRPKIERVVLMGGVFEHMQAETNILNDIGAASIVFDAGLAVTAISWDITRKVPLEPRDLERIRAVRHPAVDLLMQLLGRWHTWRPGRDPVLHDPLAVAAVFDPGLCTYEDGKVDVELAGSITRGFTRLTPADRLPKGAAATTRVSRSVDARRFLDLFVARIASAPRVP